MTRHAIGHLGERVQEVPVLASIGATLHGLLPVSTCSRHDLIVATADDWMRLGSYVVDQRVRLGMLTRGALADRSGISTRILGDIEKGRRGNFDPVTLASLEQALRWQTGSVRRVLAGHEPTVLASERQGPEEPRGASAAAVLRAIEVILDAKVADYEKVRFIRKLIAEEYRPDANADSEDDRQEKAS